MKKALDHIQFSVSIFKGLATQLSYASLTWLVVKKLLNQVLKEKPLRKQRRLIILSLVWEMLLMLSQQGARLSTFLSEIPN